MTTPAFNYKDQTQALGHELDSSIAGSEWSSFLAKRKELLDEMMKTAMPHPPEIAPPGPDGQPGVSMIPVASGSQMQKGTSDQIGQAHFWGIANPESMTAAELQHQIDQRRAEVPRDKQTSLTSALFAGGAAAAAAAGGATELIGHAFGNLGDLASNVPFVGSALSSMLNSDQSKLFWQHLQSRAAEAVEASAAMQPEADKTAFQFLTGAGKMAGYALPAIAAWEGLGAIAGMSRLAWLGRVGTPLARAAAKGALTSALLGDPDAPPESKVMNLGLGAIMGGASMWGMAGLAAAGGAIGTGIGSQVGDTPADRQRHMIEFGVGGAALGVLAPVLAQAFSKIKASFPDGTIPAEPSTGSPGTVDAEYEIINEATGQPGKPQISGNPVPAQFRALGAPGQPSPTDAEGLSALLHSEPPMQLTAGGGVAPAQPVTVEPGGLPAPRVAGYLETPGTGMNAEGTLRDADHLQRLLSDPVYAQDHGYAIDAPAAAHPLIRPGDPFEAGTVGDVIRRDLAGTYRDADAQRYNDREALAKQNRGFAEVTQGPSRLVGSKVADSNGKPLRVYHGTPQDFGEFDPTKLDGGALFGPGIYHTESPEIAAGYAGDTPDAGLADLHQQLEYNAEQIAQFEDRIANIGSDPYLRAWVDDNQNHLTALQNQRATISSMIAEYQSRRPNVRPALLDIKNPFNIDAKYSQPETQAIFDRLATALPDFDWNSLQDRVSNPDDSFGLAEYRSPDSLTGEEIYHIAAQAPLKAAVLGPEESPNWTSVDTGLGRMLGKAGLNSALQRIGYDGITHIGGARTGNESHRVWIAFDPSQVHSPFPPTNLDAPSAQTAAEAITKQATVMESGTLPQAIGKVEITESDVVDAMKHTMPGGTAVVRGVGKPLDVMREHPDVRFVEREGKLDALVGEFTDDMVADYKRWGTYEGNIVVTASGIEGQVQYITGKGMVQLKRMAGGPPLRVKNENILPSRYGDPEYTGADLWPSFKADLLRYMNEESAKVGMAPVEGLWDARVPGQIQGHLEDYLNRRGINTPSLRHAIDLAINESFVNEARDLDPESRDMQAQLGNEFTIEANDRETGDEPLPVSLEERAEARGFMWLSKPGADGGILRDLLNPEGAFETSMQTDAAAEEFLHSVDRTAPDLTPASDVPFDVMESVPTGTSFEPATGYEETFDGLQDDLRYFDREFDRMDAGGPPAPPEPPVGGGPSFSPPPELPPAQQETVGQQFGRMYRERPEDYAALERRWAGTHMRYSRYLFGAIERHMTGLGVDQARIWRDITQLETNRTKSDNELHDWVKEGGEIFRSFGSKKQMGPLFRDSFVTRTHEIQDSAEKYRRIWEELPKRGFSEGEVKKYIEADSKLTDIYHRLFMSGVESPNINFRPEQEIANYISHVRQRQAQGPLGGDPYDPRGLLSPEVQFFAEYAREGNVQFRVMDTRQLFNHYVRAMMFKKYQAADYENFVRTWQDDRIPVSIRSLATNYAGMMRFGYRPEPGMMVKSIQGVIEGMTRVPITTSEASRFAGAPMVGMYRSLMGGKLSIFFRDATQPLMALSKVRTGFLAGAYSDVLGYWRKGEGKEQLLADYALALKHGWVTRDRPSMEAATVFEAEPGSETQLLGLTPAQAAARERVAKVGDVMLPYWLQRADDFTNSLQYYGKEQQFNQFIPGIAAHRQATAALKEYRQLETRAALEGDASLAMDYDQFARKAFFSSFRPEIKNHLRDLVEAGNDEEAAATFARETVKESQYVYTTREKPAALRGGWGRFASFLGNSSGQFIEQANANMRYGEPEHIARALMVLGGFSYAMKKLGQKLGLRNLENWAYTGFLRYAGSPLMELGSQLALGYGGAMAQADNRSASPLQNEALKDLPGLVETGLGFFPYTGYLRSAGAIQEAAQGTTPVRDITRFVVTGDRGSGINFLLDQRKRAEDFQSRYDPLTGTLRPAPTGVLSPHGGTMQQSVPTTTPATPPSAAKVSTHPGRGGQQ